MSKYTSRHTGAQIDDAVDKATKVVANPELAGTETELTGLKVGDTSFKMPSGGDNIPEVEIIIPNFSRNYSSEITISEEKFAILTDKTIPEIRLIVKKSESDPSFKAFYQGSEGTYIGDSRVYRSFIYTDVTRAGITTTYYVEVDSAISVNKVTCIYYKIDSILGQSLYASAGIHLYKHHITTGYNTDTSVKAVSCLNMLLITNSPTPFTIDSFKSYLLRNTGAAYCASGWVMLNGESIFFNGIYPVSDGRLIAYVNTTTTELENFTTRINKFSDKVIQI